MPKIDPGQMDNRIAILQPTLAQDACGGTDVEEVTVLRDALPAQIVALTGKELEAAQQQVAQVTYWIAIPWIPGVRSNQSIKFTDVENRTRFFQIEAALNRNERRDFLELLCIERNDSAGQVPAIS